MSVTIEYGGMTCVPAVPCFDAMIEVSPEPKVCTVGVAPLGVQPS
jgi:hypothetical protein